MKATRNCITHILKMTLDSGPHKKQPTVFSVLAAVFQSWERNSISELCAEDTAIPTAGPTRTAVPRPSSAFLADHTYKRIHWGRLAEGKLVSEELTFSPPVKKEKGKKKTWKEKPAWKGSLVISEWINFLRKRLNWSLPWPVLVVSKNRDWPKINQ